MPLKFDWVNISKSFICHKVVIVFFVFGLASLLFHAVINYLHNYSFRCFYSQFKISIHKIVRQMIAPNFGSTFSKVFQRNSHASQTLRSFGISITLHNLIFSHCFFFFPISLFVNSLIPGSRNLCDQSNEQCTCM